MGRRRDGGFDSLGARARTGTVGSRDALQQPQWMRDPVIEMKRCLRTTAVAAIAVIPWLPAVAAGGGVASGGKAGSTTAIAAKGSTMRQHRGQSVVTGFGGSCCFG